MEDILELPSDFAARLVQELVDERPASARKAKGQFFTPPGVARFMGRLAVNAKRPGRILDPGAGTGILTAATCEVLTAGSGPVHVDLFEDDPLAAELCERALTHTSKWCETELGVQVTFEVNRADFIASHANQLHPGLYTDTEESPYDMAILNPPYFKLSKSDPRSVAASALVHGQPNIYALFMGIAVSLLDKTGVLVSITPRSFAHGDYFKRFRQHVFGLAVPEVVHLFRSRKDAFRSDAVLQETAVVLLRRGEATQEGQVRISESAGVADIDTVEPRAVPLRDVIDLRSSDLTFRIPTSPSDDVIVDFLGENWCYTLRSMQLRVSTGPVVAFRSQECLCGSPGSDTVAMLWLNNVRALEVEWPAPVPSKPQYIRNTPGCRRLLVSNEQNYVLLRRFTAKEESRRLTAAPLQAWQVPGDLVGLENHLNYIYRAGAGLMRDEVFGLAALLNSALLDRYIRISNGNTQVNASELRDLPLPSLDVIIGLGRAVLSERPSMGSIEQFLARHLALPAQVLDALRHPVPVGHTSEEHLPHRAGPPAQQHHQTASAR